MNKYILFGGAATTITLGLIYGDSVSAETAVGMGLMWMALSIK